MNCTIQTEITEGGSIWPYQSSKSPVCLGLKADPFLKDFCGIRAGRAANALSANLTNNCDEDFSLFFTHSLAPPPFLSPPLVLPDVVDTVDFLIKILLKML